jgi:hypothetical protein
LCLQASQPVTPGARNRLSHHNRAPPARGTSGRKLSLRSKWTYACAVGVCKLELRQGEELLLSQHGLSVRITARAIKSTAGSLSAASGSIGASIGAGDAPDAESYVYGANWANYNIPDCPFLEVGGDPAFSYITITGAPADKTITKVKYSARIVHQHVGDVLSTLFLGEAAVHVIGLWDRWGHNTDEYMDDDPEDDYDIDLRNRETDEFNGELVNQTFGVMARDLAWWNTGYIDYWNIYVYYEPCGTSEIPHPPIRPSPADGATNVSRSAILDWADASQATYYDVYFGTTSPPPFKGVTYSSSYTPHLDLSTHYYWKVVSRNDCGSTNGVEWDFTTQGSVYLPLVRKE